MDLCSYGVRCFHIVVFSVVMCMWFHIVCVRSYCACCFIWLFCVVSYSYVPMWFHIACVVTECMHCCGWLLCLVVCGCALCVLIRMVWICSFI